jgi:hypothetical protein
MRREASSNHAYMTPINEPIVPASSPPHLCHLLRPLPDASPASDAVILPARLLPALPVSPARPAPPPRQHASSACARTASSSNSSQCRPHSVVHPPETRHGKPVARCSHHPALLARRDAPVDPPHRQIIAWKVATSDRGRGSQDWSEQAEHSRRQAGVAE